MTAWDLKSGVSDPFQESYNNILQNIKSVLVTAPTQSIVSQAEAKNYCKMSVDTTDDNLITDLIDSATAIVEQELGGLSLYTQSWKQYQQGGIDIIQLQRFPVVGTPTISYYESFDTVTATNITATTYFRVLEDELYHVDSYWSRGRDGDGYTIEYDVGLFNASNFTSSNDLRLPTFKTAILRTCYWLYEQREESVVNESGINWKVTYQEQGLPMGIKRLLQPFRRAKGML